MELKGLRLDNIHSDAPVGTWAYAKNILLSKGFRSIENEKGTELYYTPSNTNEKIIRGFSTPIDHLIFIYDTVLTKGYLRKISNVNGIATPTDLFSSTSFNISNSFNIELVYLYNNLGNLIIAWTDNVLPPMYLDTTTSHLNVSSSNFEMFYLFPHFKLPNYYLSKIINSGDLLTGCYFVTSCYEVESGVNSNFGVISNPIFIVKSSIQDQYVSNIGCDIKETANKSFQIEVTNIDTRYKYIKIAVIYQTDTSLEAGLTEKYIIRDSKMSFIINDFSKLSFLSVNDIIVSNPSFEKVTSFTMSNNRLRLANLTKFTKYSNAVMYDTVISKFSLDWLCADSVNLLESENSYKDPCFIFNTKGFKYDEVKAFYLGFRLKTGGYYGIYHLPGRIATGREATDTITIDDETILKHKVDSTATNHFQLVIVSITNANIKTTTVVCTAHGLVTGDYVLAKGWTYLPNGRYQIVVTDSNTFTFYNGSYSTGTPVNGTICHDTPIIYGTMGYWQNENETYNNLYGTTLSNSKIRHHRFPSLLQLNTWRNNIIESTSTTTTSKYENLSETLYLSGLKHYCHLTFPTLFDTITFTQGSGSDVKDKFTIQAGEVFKLTGLYTVKSTRYADAFTITFNLTKNGVSILPNSTAIVVNSKKIKDATGYGGYIAIATLEINANLTAQLSNYDIDIQFEINHSDYTEGTVIDGSMILYNTTPTTITNLRQHILGVKLNIDYTNIPQAILDLCDGVELFYAKPSIENSIIIDQSITVADGEYTRFYGFDSMSNKLNLNATHLRAQLQYNNTDILQDDDSSILTTISTGTKYSKITSISYLPEFNRATIPSNQGKENCYIIKTKSNSFHNNLSELLNIKNNVYLDFTQQTLVSTGKIHRLKVSQYLDRVQVLGNELFLDYSFDQNLRCGDILHFTEMSSDLNGYYKIIKCDRTNTRFELSDTLNAGYDSIGQITLIPFFYGGDTFVSFNSIVTFGNPQSNLYVNIESLKSSEGLATLTLKTASVTTVLDFTMFSIGDVIIIKSLSNPEFDGTYTVASIDSNFKLTFKCSVNGTASLNSGLKLTYYPISILYVPIHSIYNIGFRQEGNNQYEKFYPKTNLFETETINTINRLRYINAMKEASIANYYIYNKTWNLINIFRQDEIDGNIETFTKYYPCRIYSATERPEDSSSSFWRKIKPLDYYDISEDRGEITRIFGHNKIMYIKTKYGLKRGITNDTLKTGDNIDIVLKSTDIFDSPVQDVFDAPNQYIQSLNSLDTTFTPYGLLTVDTNSGDIYLINNELNVISKFGIEDWFRNTIKNIDFGTTITKGNGIIVGYDEIYKRLFITALSIEIPVTSVTRSGVNGVLVTVITTSAHNLNTGDFIIMRNWSVVECNGKFAIYVINSTTFTYNVVATTTGIVTGGTLSARDFTLSFNTENKCWVCFHDYLPDQYIPNNNGLFYIKGNNIYKLNNGLYGKYEDIYYSSIIDFIFNSLDSESFLLNSVSWISTIENALIKYWNKTVSKILIYSKNQCTDINSITQKIISTTDGVISKTGNTQYSKGEWIFNDIKDTLKIPNSLFLNKDFSVDISKLETNKSWYTKSKFIGKSIIVRLIYDNDSSNNKIVIDSVKIDVKSTL